MVCFVVLHYMVLEETVGCIDNLKALSGEKRIVIVDNASSNGSGLKLKELYENDPYIDVILNKANSGFAKGNNLGCAFAKEKYSPDFYVVMNNDVEIPQKDFIDKLYDIWNSEDFDVLSPDIYSTTGHVHQSPKSSKPVTLEYARALKKTYEKKLKSRVIVPIRCFLKDIKPLKLLYNRKKNAGLGIDYTKKMTGVPLHGSCFIFSRHFMEVRDNAFFPETFFYFESEILDYECHKAGLKELYDPQLKVYHHQNVSTNVTFSNTLKRVRFMNEQNYASISAFLDAYDK